MYVYRTLEHFFTKARSLFPILLITGPRQVGKTTFLKHQTQNLDQESQIATERTYVTLDDPLLRELAERDPQLFLKRFTPPILIDEIQYAPNLFPYIKMYCDQHKQTDLFWLTGSQQFHLMKNVSESLAGRVGIVNLLGLSHEEITGQIKGKPFLPSSTTGHQRAGMAHKTSLSLKELYTLIWRGSFPAIALNKEMDHRLFYSSYVQTYLQRDVRDLTKIENEMTFLRFLRVIAARSGQMLNLADVARDSDISQKTAKHWLEILEISGIIYLLQPYHTNVTKRLIKTPKLYFLDTGLACYLTDWTSPETLEAGAMSGAILETWIIGELLKSYWHNGQKEPFYYYRDKDQKEIDLLIVQDDMFYPIEIKKTAKPLLSHIASFKALEKFSKPMKHGALICLVSESFPLTNDVTIIAISDL